MITVYLVIAAFLYWPFRKWTATAEAPALSALAWPLMVLVMGSVLFIIPFFKNIYYNFKEEPELEVEKLLRGAYAPKSEQKNRNLATLKRKETVYNLYESGDLMPSLSREEQVAYIEMLEIMRSKHLRKYNDNEFFDFLNKIKTVHLKGNSKLDSYLRYCSEQFYI